MHTKSPYASGTLIFYKAIEDQNRRQNTYLEAELRNISSLFAKASIRFVALKGAAFMAEEDGPAAWRSTSDLDLLIRPADLKKASSLLLSEHYTATADESHYREADHQHYPAMISPDRRVSVELHTRAIWDSGRDPLIASDIFDHAEPSVMENVLIPSPEHRIIHLIAHGQISDKHHVAREVTLKDVLDFGLLGQANQINWQQVSDAFERIGFKHVFDGFVSACRLSLGPAMPAVDLDTSAGLQWASIAIEKLGSRSAKGRNLMLLDIVKDYANRVLAKPGGVILMMQTLANKERRDALFKVHYNKWRK